MLLRNIFIFFSVVLSILSILPYLLDIIKGKTKPRIISWCIWCGLTTIALVAAILDRQYPTAILLFFVTIMNIPIIILGWKNGNKKIKPLEVICLVGAVIGVILWVIFNSPEIAVIATIVIDSIGVIPTIVHSWQKPNEETLSTFIMCVMKGLCTVIILTDWQITASAYPIYLTVSNFLIVAVIIFRRYVLSKKTR